jgi:hypothetical protein
VTSDEEARLRSIMEEAAEAGARRALESVGLHDETAGKDVRDLRTLIDGWRTVKRATVETVTRWLTLGLLGMLALGAYKQFGAGK